MKISVIVPTYKPSVYLWECLNSIKNQTFDKTEFEIILILNGCNEPYNSEIRNYISTHFHDYNFVFIQTDVPGVSNARNIGLDVSKGDYVSFVDDDDIISENFIEKLFNLSSEGITPVSNLLAFEDGKTQLLNNFVSVVYDRIRGQSKTHILRARSYMSIPSAKLIKRTDIGKKRFNTTFKNGEDSLFMLSISDKVKYVRAASEDVVYYRRIRTNSAVTRKKTYSEILLNNLKLALVYFPYLLQPWKYSFLFCLSRYAALFKKLSV